MLFEVFCTEFFLHHQTWFLFTTETHFHSFWLQDQTPKWYLGSLRKYLVKGKKIIWWFIEIRFLKVALLNRKSYNLFKGAKLERKLPKVASLLIIYRDLERKEFLIYSTQKEKATVYLKPSTKSLNRKSSSWIFEFVTAFHLIKKTKLV